MQIALLPHQSLFFVAMGHDLNSANDMKSVSRNRYNKRMNPLNL